MDKTRKIGILTGGGDCPGLNAVIRGAVESCLNAGIHVYGLYDGWRGALTGEGRYLSYDDVDEIQTHGGTILGTSRTNVMNIAGGAETVRARMQQLGLEGLIAIGGDDTLGVANKLRKMGMNMIGVPKTIDNDLSCTDVTFGFDTATNIAMECIDRLHTTAESHSRCIVVECMGRHTGHIALHAGLAANAHLILIPEFPKSFREISDFVKSRHVRGQKYTIIVVAEGFEFLDDFDDDDSNIPVDAFGNKMLPTKDLAKNMAEMIEKDIRSDETMPEDCRNFECRYVVLGHIQRGGAPTCADRVLGFRLGVKAGQLVESHQYGNMVALSGTEIVAADLDKAVTERKTVTSELYAAAELIFR